jgi:hypothetical protein
MQSACFSLKRVHGLRMMGSGSADVCTVPHCGTWKHPQDTLYTHTLESSNVSPDHLLPNTTRLAQYYEISTHKLIVCRYTPQNQPHALRRDKLHPLLLVLRIACRKVPCPIDSSRLGVAVVHDIVDMSCDVVRSIRRDRMRLEFLPWAQQSVPIIRLCVCIYIYTTRIKVILPYYPTHPNTPTNQPISHPFRK